MNTIRVGEDFEIERDENCWHLHQFKAGTSRKTKQPIRTKRTTYHGKLEQACQAIIDRRAGTADDLAGVISAIDSAKEEIANAIRVQK